MLPAFALRSGDEHLERRVARAGAHPSEAGIDADRARLHAAIELATPRDRVMMGMDAALCLGLQDPIVSLVSLAKSVHVQAHHHCP